MIFALLRLFLRGVGNEEPAAHLLGLFQSANDYAVREWSNTAVLRGHIVHPSC